MLNPYIVGLSTCLKVLIFDSRSRVQFKEEGFKCVELRAEGLTTLGIKARCHVHEQFFKLLDHEFLALLSLLFLDDHLIHNLWGGLQLSHDHSGMQTLLIDPYVFVVLKEEAKGQCLKEVCEHPATTLLIEGLNVCGKLGLLLLWSLHVRIKVLIEVIKWSTSGLVDLETF